MRVERTREITYLERCFRRTQNCILVIYGQENVGKTTLIREFIRDKIYFYYKARACSGQEQRSSFEKEKKKVNFPHSGKKVLVIDEFQHMVKTSPDFMLQIIEYVRDNPAEPLFVLLCSSSVGWVENDMISRMGKAAFGIAGLLKIREFGCRELQGYFPGFTHRECVGAYALLGGLPGLWQQLDDSLSLEENICRTLLAGNRPLFRECERIVEEQLRETGVYNTILTAIAAGQYKLNDLYLSTGFSRAKISVYLRNLMELELAEKIFSYDTAGKANTQKGIYRIKNHLLHFCHTFLYPNYSGMEILAPQEFYRTLIAPGMESYSSRYYQMACAQYLERRSRHGCLSHAYGKSGEWVGKDGGIDIVMQDEQGHTLIGLCSYTNAEMDGAKLSKLLLCADQAKLEPDEIYLFSAGGFTDALKREAAGKEISYIGLEELMEQGRMHE